LTDTPKNKRRGTLSKLDAMELSYRGGYELGFEAALSSVKAVLEAAEAHVQELEAWALSDPSLEADPPALSLGAPP